MINTEPRSACASFLFAALRPIDDTGPFLTAAAGAGHRKFAVAVSGAPNADAASLTRPTRSVQEKFNI